MVRPTLIRGALVHPVNSTIFPKSSLPVTVALTIAMLYFGRQIFIPLALAVILSFALTPMVATLERARLGRIPSVIAVLALCFALTLALVWGAAGQLIEITSHIRDYESNLKEKIHSLHSTKDSAFGRAADSVRELNKELSVTSQSANAVSERREGHPAIPLSVQVTAPPSNLLQDLRAFLGPLAGPLETASIVVIFTAFTLIKREDLRNRLIRLGGQGRLTAITQALDDASRRLSRYLLLQILVNASYGAFFGLGLYLIGVPHALLWGALAGVLRLVPYIGTLAAAVFPVAMALAIFPGWSQAWLSFGLFLVLELCVANILEPWLYGAHTGISSIAILVSAVFWTMLWGTVGLILSTPLTVCLMLLGRYIPQLDFLEVLLGDEPALKPEEHFYQRLLALDQDEARNIAETHLQQNSLETVYETVLIPALRLAEEDRHMGVLDDGQSGAILQSTRELLEDLDDRVAREDAEREDAANDGHGSDVCPVPDDSQFAALRVGCIPARDEADELVAMMLVHLLRQAGIAAACLPIGAVDDMLEQVSRAGFDIVCVSALPPFAVGQARSLCRRLRARFPELNLAVGLWQFSGGVSKAQERIGPTCATAVATSLSEALLQIRRLAQSIASSSDHPSSTLEPSTQGAASA